MDDVAPESRELDSAGVYFMSVEEFESRSEGESRGRSSSRCRWFELRKVGLDFLESARMVYVVECDVDLPRMVVWEALVDAFTWKAWFPGVRAASYRGSPPYGVGTIRVAEVRGCHFEETMLAWDEGRRWAYRIDRATVPLAKAQLESTELEDRGEGTRVRWLLAMDPGIVMKLSAPFFRRMVQRLLERAMKNLESRMAGHEPKDR